MASELPNVIAALVALAEAGIPTDVQELLVRGDASRGIAPGAIIKALNTRAAPADLKARDRKRYKLIRKSLQNKGLLPAATDTGLVTVGYVREDFIPNYVTIWSVPHGNSTVAVCLRSQAEELLAAERAAQQRLLDIIEEANDDKEALEAKLAAAEKALEAARPYVEDYDTRRHNTGVDETLTQIDAVLGGKPS